MAKLYNLARMTTATTGTGTITLGSAVTGWLSFASAGVSNGDIVDYAINDPGTSPTASEIGTGTYTASGTTLTRTVLKSTNSDTAINLSGNAHVFITPNSYAFNPVTGGVYMTYLNGAWVVFAPDGTPISTSSTTTSGLQEAINYAQTNGYNLKVVGPTTTSGGTFPAYIDCSTSVTVGPATFTKFEIDAIIRFDSFSGNAFIVDTLSNCILYVNDIIERSGGGASDVTVLIDPQNAEPVFGSKSFQQNDIRFNGVKLYGASSANVAVAHMQMAAGYQIVNNKIHFGSVDAGAGYAVCGIRANMPATSSGSAFGNNRISWTLCVGATTHDIFNGHTTRPSDIPFGANTWEGCIESNGTVSTHFNSYASYDTILISSMSVDSGTCATGIVFQSGANNNFFVIPEIVATAAISDSGTYNYGYYSVAGQLSVNYTPPAIGFSANKGGTDQTGIADVTFTQVTFGTESFDTGSHFASSAWTPPAGLISMKAAALATGTWSAGAQLAIQIRKDGTSIAQGNWYAGAASNGGLFVACDDRANGSNVYTVYVYVDTSSGTATLNGSAGNTYFSGAWIGR